MNSASVTTGEVIEPLRSCQDLVPVVRSQITGPPLIPARVINNAVAIEFSCKVEALARDPSRIVALSLRGRGRKPFERFSEERKMRQNPQHCGTIARAIMALASEELLPGVQLETVWQWRELIGVLNKKRESAVIQVYLNSTIFVGAPLNGSIRMGSFFPGHVFTIIKFAEEREGNQSEGVCFRVFQSFVERYSLQDYVDEHTGEYLIRRELESKILDPLNKLLFHRGSWTIDHCNAFYGITGVNLVELNGKIPRKGFIGGNFTYLQGKIREDFSLRAIQRSLDCPWDFIKSVVACVGEESMFCVDYMTDCSLNLVVLGVVFSGVAKFEKIFELLHWPLETNISISLKNQSTSQGSYTEKMIRVRDLLYPGLLGVCPLINDSNFMKMNMWKIQKFSTENSLPWFIALRNRVNKIVTERGISQVEAWDPALYSLKDYPYNEPIFQRFRDEIAENRKSPSLVSGKGYLYYCVIKEKRLACDPKLSFGPLHCFALEQLPLDCIGEPKYRLLQAWAGRRTLSDWITGDRIWTQHELSDFLNSLEKVVCCEEWSKEVQKALENCFDVCLPIERRAFHYDPDLQEISGLSFRYLVCEYDPKDCKRHVQEFIEERGLEHSICRKFASKFFELNNLMDVVQFNPLNYYRLLLEISQLIEKHEESLHRDSLREEIQSFHREVTFYKNGVGEDPPTRLFITKSDDDQFELAKRLYGSPAQKFLTIQQVYDEVNSFYLVALD